jgi:hypothetical protein
LNAYLIFEVLNLPAQGRLRDVERPGGAAEVQVLGDGDEVSQVA